MKKYSRLSSTKQVALALAAMLFLGHSALAQTTSIWSTTATGSWANASNWSAGNPNSSGTIAEFTGSWTNANTDPNMGTGGTVTVGGLWVTGSTAAGRSGVVNITGTNATMTISSNTINSNASALIVLDGTGTQKLTFEKTTKLTLGSSGTFFINSTSAAASALTISGSLNLGSNTLTFGGTSALGQQSVTGIISGATGSLVVNTSGTVFLSGVNTFGGGVTLLSGTLNVNNNGSLGTGTLTLSGGNIGNTPNSARVVTSISGVTINNSFSAFNGGSTASNNLTLGGSVVTYSGNNTITVNGAANLTFTGTVNNSLNNSLTTAGTGTLTFSAWNVAGNTTFTGNMTGSGSLVIGNLNNSGNNTITLNGGASPVIGVLNQSGSVTFAGNVTGGAIITNIFNSANSTTTANSYAVNIGSTAVGASTGFYNLSADGGAYNNILTGSSNYIIAAQITDGSTGRSRLTYAGTGTLSLLGNSTFTSGLTVASGTALLGATNALGYSTVTLGSVGNSATIDLNGGSRKIYGLTTAGTAGNQTITNSSGTAATLNFTTLNPGITTTFGGVIQDGVGGVAVRVGGSTPYGAPSGANVVFTNAQTYTGTTTIASGSLALGNGGTAGSISGSSAVVDNGSFIFNRSNTLTQGTDFGVISGTGSVSQVGAGTTVLNSANTYSGGTKVTSGTLTVNNASGLGTGSLDVSNTNTGAGSNVSVNLAGSGATTIGSLSGSIATPSSGTNTATIYTGAGQNFTINQTAAGTYAGVIAGSGNLVLGTGSTQALILTGANTYTGSTSIKGGTLQLGNGGTTGSLVGSTPIVDNGIFAVNRSNTATQGNDFGTVSGSGSFVQSGSGTTVLTGANTYSGNTVLKNGTLQVGNGTSGSVSSDSALVSTGGNFVLKGNTSGTTTQSLNGTKLNGGATQISADSNGGAGTTLNLGALTVNNGAVVDFSGSGTITTTTANTDFTSFGGTNTILGGWATVGGSTWAVSAGDGTNPGAITGLTTFNTSFAAGGDVDAAVGSYNVGTQYINSLRLNNTGTYAFGASGTVTIASGGILETANVGSNAASFGASLTITTGSLQNLYIDQENTAGTLSIFGSLTGAMGVVKSGAGTLLLNASNTFTGGVYVDAGTLALGNAGSTGTNTVTMSGTSTLDLNGGSRNIASISDGGAATGQTITNSSATAATINFNTTANSSFGGVIQDGAGVVNLVVGVNGNSVSPLVNLYGQSTYSGTTTVYGAASILSSMTSQGLIIGSSSVVSGGSIVSGALGKGDVHLKTNSILMDNGSTITIANNIFLDNTGYYLFGSTASSPGTLIFDGSNVGSGATFSLSGNAYFYVDNTTVIRDSIIGTAGSGIVKYGYGTLVLGAADSVTGATYTINQGTLLLDFSQSTAPTSNILAAGSTIVFGTTGSQTVPGSSTLAIQGKAGTANSQSLGNIGFPNNAAHLNLIAGDGGSLTVNVGTVPNLIGYGSYLDIEETGSVVLTTTSAPTGTTVLSYGNIIINGTDFASINSSNEVVPYAYYTPSTATSINASAAFGATDMVTGTTVLTGSPGFNAVNGLRFNTAQDTTLTLNGTNVSLGTVQTLLETANVGAHTVLIDGTGNININSRGLIVVQNNTAGIMEIDVSLTPHPTNSLMSLGKGGLGTLVLGGLSSYSAGSNLDEGTTIISRNAVQAFSQTINIASTSGSATFTVTDASNLYVGEVVNPGSSGLLANSPYLMIASISGDVITLNQAAATTGTGTITFLGGSALGTPNYNASSGASATVAVGYGATLQIGNGGTSGSLINNQLINTAGGTIILNRSDNFTLTNVIAQFTSQSSLSAAVTPGLLIKQGAGTATINSINNYQGATIISGGVLSIGSASVTGTSVSAFVTSGSAQIYVSAALMNTNTLALGESVSGTGINPGTVVVAIIPPDQAANAGYYTIVLNTNAVGSSTNVTFGPSSSLTVGGTNSSIGASSSDASNLVLDGGSLQVVDANNSTTDRLFTITTNSGTIDSSGAGVVNFTNTGTIAFTGAGARSLTLTGTNTGANTLNPSLGDGYGGSTSLVKNGTGTWYLGGTNTYTGATTINAGLLVLSNNLALQNSPLNTNSAGHLAVAAGITSPIMGGLTGTTNLSSVFDSSYSTVTGITLNPTGTMNNSYSGNITDGAAGMTLTKTGSGTQTLAGINSYTGATTISGGILNITGQITNSAVTVAKGGTLSGTGTLGSLVTVAGGGKIDLHAMDSTIGKLTVGGLTLGNSTTASSLVFDIGSTSGSVDQIIDNGNLTFLGTGGTVITIDFNGAPGTLQNGNYTLISYTGTLTGSLSNISLATTTLDGKSLSLSTLGGSPGNGQLVLTVSSAPQGTSYTLAVSTGGVTAVHASGTISLTNSIVNTGTTGAGADSLAYTGLGATSTSGSITGVTTSGTIAPDNGTGTNSQVYTAGTGSGTVTFTSGVTSATNATVGGSATFSGSTTASVTVYTGQGVWKTNGSGTWGTISASPVNWTVAGGTPGLDSNFQTTDTATFDNANGVTAGGTATVSLGGQSPSLKGITFTTTGGGYTIDNASGGGTLTLNGGGSGATLVDNGGSSASQTISAPILLSDNLGIAVAATDTITLSGTVSGSGSISLAGPGKLILTGSNTYIGGTTVNSGTLQLASSTTVTGSVITSGPVGTGTLSLADGSTLLDNGTMLTIANSLSLNGTINISGPGGGGFNFDGSAIGSTVVLTGNTTLNVQDNTTIADNISGNFDLTKIGAGTLNITGSTSSTGATNVTSGTLTVANGNSLGSGTISLGNGTALEYTGTSSGTLNQNVTITGTSGSTGYIASTGGNVLTLSGTINKDGKVLSFNGGKIAVTGHIVGSSSNSDLVVDGTGTNTIVGLANTNTYNGPTYVYGGSTLLTGVDGALPVSPASDVTLGKTTDNGVDNTLDLLGTSQVVNSLTSVTGTTTAGINQIISSNGSATNPGIGSGASSATGTLNIAYSGGTTDTYSGLLGDSNGTRNANNFKVIKSGTGALELSGANSYTGGTEVQTGTMIVTNISGSATGSGVFTLDSGALLKGTGTIQGTSNIIKGNVQVQTSNTDISNTLTIASTSGSTTFDGANLSFNLDSASSSSTKIDLLDSSSVIFSNTPSLTLNIVYNSSEVTSGTTYELFTSTASSNVFNGIGYDENNKITSGINFTFSNLPNYYNTNSYLVLVNNGFGGYNIDVVVVPEPGTWALMLGGLALLVVFQRLRRSKDV